ncbi:MAG TPA: hypothetical protein V6D00_03195 [Pantanalinema sp.]
MKRMQLVAQEARLLSHQLHPFVIAVGIAVGMVQAFHFLADRLLRGGP